MKGGLIVESKINKRQELINITANYLIRYGSNSFSTTDIGKEAKVTQPLIHYYFKTKEGILEEAYKWLQRNDPHGAEWVRERERRDERSLIRRLL